MPFRTIAYIIIGVGCLFTAWAIYIIYTLDAWLDIIFGWFFLGPLPIIMGIVILRYTKSKANLSIAKKIGKKRSR